MNKCLAVLLMVSGLTSCTVKNDNYYKLHPEKLRQVVKSCPERQPTGLTCEQLEGLAKRMNELAYQLQSSPQGFGAKILSLQETLAAQQKQLKNEGANPQLQASIDQNKHDLSDYMAVVQWLESPAS